MVSCWYFQCGKTQRDGSDQLSLTHIYNDTHSDTYPICGAKIFVELRRNVGWDISRGYLSQQINAGANGRTFARGKASLSAAHMTAILQRCSSRAGQKADQTMHLFRPRVVSNALAGDSMSSITQIAL